MKERVRLVEALASVEQFGGELAEAAEQAILRATDQESSFEERVEEEVRSRSASLDSIKEQRTTIEESGEALDQREREIDRARDLYVKTAKEIQAEVRPVIRAEEQKRADKEIDEARRLANELVAQANARSAEAILKAEGARIEQLTLLLNRFAHELVALDPSKVELYDYLVLTGQQKGRSNRKDCTNDDLKKIRAAHESRL